MSHTIEAIYEDGIFKPLGPVNDVPDGARVRLDVELSTEALCDWIRQRLLSEGHDLDEIERVLEKLIPLWRSYDTLTPEQREELERLERERY